MDGISVIIPCYNATTTLSAALQSALAQEAGCPVELLVCDDGSTDDSRDVAARFKSVRVLRHPGGDNRGISATRNLGIQVARYRYLALLDADDVWLPGHLAGLHQALQAHPGAALAYANGGYLIGNVPSVSSRFPEGHTSLTAEQLLTDSQMVPSGMMLCRERVQQVGGFDEGLRAAEDQDLFLRLLERWPSVYVPRRTFLYRMHQQQITRTAALWEGTAKVLERACARHPYPRSAINRRRAVVAFRLGESAWGAKRHLQALAKWAQAVWFDPSRAREVLLSRARAVLG